MESSWIQGFAGGLLIGLAAAILLLGNGRIMGASGILGGLLDGSGRSQRAEWLAFLTGLIGTPALLVAAGFGQASPPVAGLGVMALAGLLVGFGTRLGNGCTSGHGVCGISRLSRRGLVATMVYLVTGAIAVVLARGLGWAP